MSMLDALVPPAARAEPARAARHREIAVAMLWVAAGVLAVLLLYIGVRGRPSAVEVALFAACAAAPLLGALLIRLRGRILEGLLFSTLAGIAAIVFLVHLTGGILSPMLPWLLATLAMIVTFGNQRVMSLAALAVGLAVVLLYGATIRGWIPDNLVPPSLDHELALLTLLSSTAMVVVAGVYVMRERATARERLRAARDAAEAANRAKSTFLSSVSHELRTPLATVIGFAEVLKYDQKAPPTPAQAEHLAHILTAGDHLLALVNQIIEMSRIDAGDVELRIEDVRVGEVAASALAMVELAARERGIAIEDSTRRRTGVLVRADATRLRQVLLNLLSNALKYNRDGGRVTLDTQMVDGGWLRIAISDTGPGIAPARRQELFGAFARLGAESGRVQGAGLGLAISKRLVEMMAGRIGCDSVEGEGSTFWVDLPVAS